jgi:hypothetical protein
MKWILCTGTWRLTSREVENDVRAAVREVLSRGDGIVTGGATGVDYFAMHEAMKLYPDGSRLKVVIPAFLESYIKDYYANWCMEPVTKEKINDLEEVLRRIKAADPCALIEMPYDMITQYHYDLHNDEEVKISDEVYAFQVNDSTGTQDTIDKALRKGLSISLHKKYIV